MSELNKTQERVIKVLENMIKMAKNSTDDAEMFADMLEDGLNEIQGMDGFGSEGQCDPRGDFRECEWCMDFVQGVDE